MDRDKKGRFVKESTETHCKRGHCLKNNVYTWPTRGTACKICMKIDNKNYKIKHPWASRFSQAKIRCRNKNSKSYYRYGGRGIKFLMTMADFKFLWFRDKAYNIKRPSIDRIDNDGNYELKNCRFIEKSENSRKDKLGEKNYIAKLTNLQVKDIRRLVKTGVKQYVVAKQFRVVKSVVCNVVNYNTYKKRGLKNES